MSPSGFLQALVPVFVSCNVVVWVLGVRLCICLCVYLCVVCVLCVSVSNVCARSLA
jgi:hypothetical protein